jgi:hypothetical protein
MNKIKISYKTNKAKIKIIYNNLTRIIMIIFLFRILVIFVTRIFKEKEMKLRMKKLGKKTKTKISLNILKK